MTLGTKLVGAVVLAAAVGIVLFGALVQMLLQSFLTQEIDTLLAARAGAVVEEIRGSLARSGQPSDSGRPRLELGPVDEFSSPGVYVQVSTANGEVLTRSANLGTTQLPPRLVFTSAGVTAGRFETVPLDSGERVRVYVAPLEAAGQTLLVQVGQSLHFVDATLRTAIGALAISGGVLLLVLGLLTWLSVGRLLVNLTRITAAAEHIAATGDVDQSIPDVGSSDEAGRLASALTQMTTRLRLLLETQRHLLADTAHELRNPLTVISTNLDFLKLEIDAATRREVADESLREAERMSQLVDDLLLLAEVEAQGQQVTRENVRLDELIRSTVRDMSDLPAMPAVSVTVTDPLVVRGNAEQLRRVIVNLLENAARYAGPDASVHVTVGRQDRRGIIEVGDTGPGIAAEHLPHLFDRFYRVDSARHRSTGGTGLGLAIVREIVQSHGGSIQVESEPGQGSTFAITLPAEPSWVPLAAHSESGSGQEEPRPQGTEATSD